MIYDTLNFEHLIGQIPGLSESQLRNHFELYAGYVKKLNEIESKLKTVDRMDASYSYASVSELQRRRAVAYNGVHLHEYYFKNLTGEKTQPGKELASAIIQEFGSEENWYADTLAGLKTANGWVLLCCSREEGIVSNCVVEEHHRGILVDQDIILAIDGWEHAFMIDYGVKEADYFKAIRPSLDWDVASARFEAARRRLAVAA